MKQSAYGDVPPSAQPESDVARGAKKLRTFKKNKKGKKTHLSQPRGAPWPPRSSNALSTAPRAGSSQSSSLPTEYIGIQNFQSGTLGADEHDTYPTAFAEEVRTHASEPPRCEDQIEIKNRMLDTDPAPSAAHSAYEMVDIPPQQGLDHTVVHSSDLSRQGSDHMAICPSNMQFEEPVQPIESQADAHTPHHADQNEPEPTPMELEHEPRPSAPGPKVQHARAQQSQHVVQEHVEANEPEAHWIQDSESPIRRPARQLKQPEVFLPDISRHSAPYRVEKPPKTKRIPSGPRTLAAPTHPRIRAPAVHSEFEQTIENLRAAYVAEQDRKNNDLAKETKHFEELKTRLENEINHHRDMADEWKDRHDGLKFNVERMREKAKTNQKYVTGLQKDYEKLQKAAVSRHEDCKKALQQQIAEVEKEKNELRRDFDATLDKVSKGQRSLRQTIDDLYVRLIISESKRKDLAENMTKQVAMYEEEKAKRNDVEKQLLSSVQGVQQQLGDHSTQFIDKLESLQAMVESAQAQDKSDPSAQECLVALKQLQSIPFLTTKDLEKAAGMLRFVHEG